MKLVGHMTRCHGNGSHFGSPNLILGTLANRISQKLKMLETWNKKQINLHILGYELESLKYCNLK